MSDIRTTIKNKSKDLSLVGLWDVVNQVELAEPVKSYEPHIWYWKDLHPIMLEAGKNIPLSEADRRVMILSNPAVYPKHYSTNTLYVSCSIYNAGETAPVHRHTPSASRFVLEGDGGYTNIEGEKCVMSRGDLIITPNGTWHDHGNEGKGPVLWVDVLDLPLVETLGATQFEFNLEKDPSHQSNSKDKVKLEIQPVRDPIGHSTNVYGTGGMVPTFVSHQRGRSRATPMLHYRWEDTQRALERLRDYEGSPYDGVMMEYVNPMNGEPVTTTMSFYVQMLRPGEHTKRHRHTSSTAYCCLSGSGKTIAGDHVMEWGRNDMFVVPSWTWHEHMNNSASEDAILYSVSDAATLHRLGLYREEAAA